MSYINDKEIYYKSEINRLNNILKITKKSSKRKPLLNELAEYKERLSLVQGMQRSQALANLKGEIVNAQKATNTETD